MKLISIRDARAQSTLEYLIVLAVILGIILLASKTIIKPAVENSLTKLGGVISNAADNF